MPSRATPSRPADHLRLVVPPAAVAAGAVPSAKAAGIAAPKLGAAAGKAFGDWVWQGLGVGAATASAGFATYAMIFSTGEVVPSGNFNLFARYDRLYQAPGARHGSAPDAEVAPEPEAAPTERRTDTARGDSVDYTPTGSLAAGSAEGDGRTAAAGRTRSGPENRLTGFTLRDVFDGKALVESRSSLSVVKPGSVLAGAGEVLSIEKRGERWVVLTANGMITGQHR